MAHLKTKEEVIKDNIALSETVALREQLRSAYHQNAVLTQKLALYEQQGVVVAQCQAQIARLRGVLHDLKQKQGMPSQRQEIKDRIIMKLQDELICCRIQLKQYQLQLSRLTKMQ